MPVIRLCRSRSALMLANLIALAVPIGAAAQVIEIGEGGVMRVYDRPSTFDAEGGTPIQARGPKAAGPAVTLGLAQPLPALTTAAEGAELSADLVEAVAWRESRLRPGVVSRAGAVGEMQLMPATARAMGVDPHDSGQNYRGGATDLRAMMQRYDGDLTRALAAYNAGPGAVDRYKGVPPYKETQAYVAAIMERLSRRAASADSVAAQMVRPR